jgi:hypothetical protein
MVERSIAWLVADANRRVPYRGLVRNQQWLSVRVAAINLRRLIAMGLNQHSAGWVLPDEGFNQRARGVNEGRLYGLSHPAWPACTLKHRRFGSDISRARQQPTPPATSRGSRGCSAGSQ